MIQYLAGIFDAEGYVRIRKTNYKNPSYTPEIRIYMCSKEIIEQFCNLYGSTLKVSNRGINRKTAYYTGLGVNGLKSTSFISDFLPYLNEKRIQLEEVKNLLDGTKDKEKCYQDYMVAKTSFNHPVIDNISYEYLAGIMDGDGWFSMFNSSNNLNSIYNNFSVGLQQRYKPLVEYMTKFGGSNVITNKVYDYNSHVQTYSWNLNTSKMLPFLENILPFLIEKKEKCKLFIEYVKEFEKFRNYSESILNQIKDVSN